MNKSTVLILTLMVTALSQAASATESAGAAGGDVPGAAITAKLQTLRPDLPIASVSATPIPNMLAVELVGGTMLYATADGRYFIAGDLYEMGDTELVNLTEAKNVEQRKVMLSGLDVDDMVVFRSQGDTKAVINVFTDVDCGYCRKLHLEVPKLNEMGVEVRYLAYPRAGLDSESYEKIVSAWCAEDPNDAMTRLKRGEIVPVKSCDNPVAAQYQLGVEIGIRGTPAILFEDGTLVPGYMPADELVTALGI